jgi:hypothetical protein
LYLSSNFFGFLLPYIINPIQTGVVRAVRKLLLLQCYSQPIKKGRHGGSLSFSSPRLPVAECFFCLLQQNFSVCTRNIYILKSSTAQINQIPASAERS